MNMLSIKLLGAVAVAGLVAAGGTAFTATGLTSSAPAAAVIGGTIPQTVNGADLSSVAYMDGAVASTGLVDTVVLTFGSALPTTASVTLKASSDAIGTVIAGNENLTCVQGGDLAVFTCTLAAANTATLGRIDVTVS
jgi:hypothetical protein